MKTVNKLAIVTIGLLTPFAAFAASIEDAYIANVRRGPGIPVPVAVVAPEGHSAQPGDKVELEFVVDAAGKPTLISVKSSTDSTLAQAAREALTKWRFEPAMRDGKPVAVKVLLPFRVSETIESGFTVASMH